MKLLSWNVQWFRGVDGVVDVDRVIRHARNLCDFDVLCLQEVSAHLRGLAGGGDADQAAAVARLLPGYEVIFAPCVDYRNADAAPRERFGNLVATRLPALLVEHHPLPFVREAGRDSVRRVCTSVLVQARSGPVTVMNTHLEYSSAAQRALQVQRILDIHRENADLACSDLSGQPVAGLYQSRPRTARTVLCGDFNFDAGSSEHLSLQRGQGEQALCDVYALVHGPGARPPTFGVYDRTYVKQPIACDHILASRDVAGLTRQVGVDGETQYSDHQPVYAEWEGL